MTRDSLETVGVVTCFLRHDARVLLVRRSGAARSYSGRWGGVAGHAEDDPDAAARTEIREETGLGRADVTFVRAGEPFPVEDHDRGTRWLVHPYLFDAATRDVEVNYETAEYAWVHPPEIRRLETVPDLWESYDRVRPTVETVAGDREHGSAYLSLRALEVLRDEAALAADGDDGGWTDLVSIARRLRESRPSMPVLGNRVDRAMDAARETRTPAALETAATDGIERALTADRDAAAVAADHAGSRIATLSRSGTVLEAIARVNPAFVLVAESRPGREGIATAEAVADRTDAAVTLTTDAAFAGELVAADVGTLLVGADAVLADGRVVNKVGTRSAATAASREGIDCYAVAASDKVSPDDGFDPEGRDPAELYDGDADLTVANPTFEATPAERFDAVLTERGPLGPDDLRDLADTHRERAAWAEDA